MIPLDRTFVIEQPDDDLHALDISCWDWGGQRRLEIHSNFRHVNGAGNHSCGLSESMARQLANGLIAVLSKQFDRAATETQLRVEEDRRRRDEAIRTENRSKSHRDSATSQAIAPLPAPELDSL